MRSVFDIYVDTGINAGTIREYIGDINNQIDSKTGLTRKDILEKEYSISEYKNLLRNIEKHNIKLYNEYKENKIAIGKLGGSGFWNVKTDFFKKVGYLDIKMLIGQNKRHDQNSWVDPSKRYHVCNAFGGACCSV